MVSQRTRRPLPWSVVAGIAVHMAEQGHFAMSLAWLTMFDCYLRPGECLDLEVNQVLPSPGVDGMMRTALLLHPDERGIASKTGELNESVLVHKKWLGKLLSQWARHRKALKQSTLWGFTLAQLRKQFLEASQAYCLRYPVIQGHHCCWCVQEALNWRCCHYPPIQGLPDQPGCK